MYTPHMHKKISVWHYLYTQKVCVSHAQIAAPLLHCVENAPETIRKRQPILTEDSCGSRRMEDNAVRLCGSCRSS